MKSAGLFLLAVLLWPVAAAAQVGNSCATNGTAGLYNPTGTIEGSLLCSSGSWVYPAFQIGSTAATCNSTNAGTLQWTGSAFQGCNGSSWQGLGGTAITLGTSASVTNPQRSGDATTGLFSAATGTVSVSSSGTDIADFSSAGLTLNNSGAALTVGASGSSTTKINIGPTTGAAAPSNVVSGVVTTANATAQTANISATTLVTPSANTYYRATCYVVLSRAASTSSTLPNCDIKYTDVDSGTAVTKNIAATGTLLGTTNTLGSSLQGSMMFYATSGDVVQYDTGGTTAYASSGSTTMQYAVHVKLEQMQYARSRAAPWPVRGKSPSIPTRHQPEKSMIGTRKPETRSPKPENRRLPVFLLSFLVSAFGVLISAPAAQAGCSNPSGNAGDMMYSSAYNVYQYCNGTNWIAMGEQGATAYATPTLLQHTAANASTVTFSSTTTAGSLIVACIGSWDEVEASYAVTDTAGNGFTRAVGVTENASLGGTGDGGTAACYYAVNKAATASDQITVVASPTNLGTNIFAAEFSGIAASSPVDVTAANTGNSTNPSSGSATTTNANDLIFGFAFVASSVTQGAGFTSIDNNGGNQDEYETETATGSYAATFSGSSQEWIAQMVAFKAGCSSPAGNAGDLIYNSAQHVYQFCNGAAWVAMGPTGAGGSCTSPSGNEADMIYNSGSNVMQYCNGAWVGMGY